MDYSPAGLPALRAAPRSLALATAAILLLSSCTPGAGAPDDAVEQPSAPPSTASSAPTTAAAAGAPPLREARAGWKVFTDPARLLSFELPGDWLVQPMQVAPEAYAPDSLHYVVRTPAGATAAELHTGVLTPEVPCTETELTPYYVIGSEPLDEARGVPEGEGVEPRFVIRLITGFRFFGSYGITDQPGGENYVACSLANTVQGGGVLGRVSFGDLEVLVPKAPADTGPATVSFGTIGEAEEYYAADGFTVIGEVIRSLRLAGGPD